MPILSYFVLNNQTFNVNYESSANFPIAYDIKIDDIHVNTVEGFTTKSFQMNPGTDVLEIKLGGIDGSFLIDGSLKFLKFIPFDVSAFNLTNMTIDIKL